MPTFRQSLVASLTRFYPFYSGCATFANRPLLHKLAGASGENVWSRVPGGEVIAPLNDFVGRAAYYVGDLDRKITWICAKIVRPGDTVLDIGANIGLVTLWLSSLVGRHGKVHSFEPNPALHKLLDATFERNRVSNVSLHRIALGSEPGLLALQIPKFNAGGASLVRDRESSDCDVVQVPVRRLSDVVAEEGIRSIQLIKIDVEGFEAEVLQGGKQVLESVRPEAILFELNEDAKGPVREQPIMKILNECGYNFFSIPRCTLTMHLERFDFASSSQLDSHDYLAVPKGECYDRIAKLVKVPA